MPAKENLLNFVSFQMIERNFHSTNFPILSNSREIESEQDANLSHYFRIKSFEDIIATQRWARF